MDVDKFINELRELYSEEYELDLIGEDALAEYCAELIERNDLLLSKLAKCERYVRMRHMMQPLMRTHGEDCQCERCELALFERQTIQGGI